MKKQEKGHAKTNTGRRKETERKGNHRKVLQPEEMQKTRLPDVIDISQSAWYARWRDPDMFRVGELRRIYDFLNVPAEERNGLI